MSPALASHFTQDKLLPRPHGGMGRGAVLALLAHGALVLALTSTVQWRTRPPEVFSAELWSAVPQAAAPMPAPAPTPAPLPPPPPPPPPKAAPAAPPVPPPRPPAAPERDADIATEQARKLEAARREKELEAAKAEKAEKAEKLAKAKAAEAERKAQEAQRAKAEADSKDKREAEARKAEDSKRKAEENKRKAEERKREDAERKAAAETKAKADAQAKVEDERLARQREENLRRMMGQAGTSGAAPAGAAGTGGTGTAAQGGAPSASYVGRLIGLIKPNIVFTGQVEGNPSAEVEVRAAPSGAIISKKLVVSSGNKDWDEAVLRAIDRTATLPRDNDGRVPPALILVFRPGG